MKRTNGDLFILYSFWGFIVVQERVLVSCCVKSLSADLLSAANACITKQKKTVKGEKSVGKVRGGRSRFRYCAVLEKKGCPCVLWSKLSYSVKDTMIFQAFEIVTPSSFFLLLNPKN